jgi:fluoride ion exporter CrcB/FEX
MPLVTMAAFAVLGAVGAVLRYSVVALVPRSFQPWALLAVNALGSASIGVASGAASVGALDLVSVTAVAALAAGFTTLSSFALSSAESIDSGRLLLGIGIAVQHVVFGVVCAGAGYISASLLFSA